MCDQNLCINLTSNEQNTNLLTMKVDEIHKYGLFKIKPKFGNMTDSVYFNYNLCECKNVGRNLNYTSRFLSGHFYWRYNRGAACRMTGF